MHKSGRNDKEFIELQSHPNEKTLSSDLKIVIRFLLTFLDAFIHKSGFSLIIAETTEWQILCDMFVKCTIKMYCNILSARDQHLIQWDPKTHHCCHTIKNVNISTLSSPLKHAWSIWCMSNFKLNYK